MLELSPKTILSLFVLIASLYLSRHYYTFPALYPFAIMSASPGSEPEQPIISLDEYIDHCVSLHNTLLAKCLPPNSPAPETSTDLVQRYESFRANGPFDTYDIPPPFDPDLPLARLISQLKTTTPPPGGNLTPFTPLLYQPVPEYFFPHLYKHDIDEADSPFILLYPQHLPSDSQYASDGGLFESGRYIHDPTTEDGLRIQKWVPVSKDAEVASHNYPSLQLFEATSEWERLLSAIEARLPSSPTPEETETSAGKKERTEPLQLDGMEDLHLSKFATQFLVRAHRPKGWTFVALGIGTHSSTASLRSVYAGEAANSFRRTFESSVEGMGWVTLLLPSVGIGSTPVHVSADVKGHLDPDVNCFDEPYGFGKATIGRRAGLYTSWADERDGDLVQLVCPSGRTNAGVFGGACPWGPDRGPRLAEVLGHWANLVEDGVWKVGEDGVEEEGAWWDEHAELANLKWEDFHSE
ncbi:hypothetical protein B0I37DRAFT_419042 [Chaetomium sp. MPI-CAGE-AT-0009]|nr:hypothetical protein B0I37DRAFT_419042 [Chaetomium sp. MPI-CAGE-AT-0009]